MFQSQACTNWVASCLLLLAAASCDGAGCGIAMDPLPGGGLPTDQTVEGAVQVRISPAGLDKVEAAASTLIGDALAGGFCLGPTEAVGTYLCTTTSGVCDPGCQVDLAIDSLELSTPDTQTLRLALQLDAESDVHVDAGVKCVLGARVSNAQVQVSLPLRINPATGELRPLAITSDEQVSVQISDIALSGCSAISDILEALGDALIGLLRDSIRSMVSEQINVLLQTALPDPLGLEGVLDVGSLLGSLSSGSGARVELRALAGGFASLPGNGLSVGAILGVNSDRDPATRTRDQDNQPARCVPPWPAPDLSAAPVPLSPTVRGTYLLEAAPEFLGVPEADADLAIGVSETGLDLIGHHAVTSGALCLNLGTEQVPALNLGAIGLLVPSLGLLGQGNEPLLLGTRPTVPLDFTVGEGVEGSPSLTVHLRDFEIDLYAFLFERYVRVFSLRLSGDVGVDLELGTTAGGAPALLPVLSGLDAKDIEVAAMNTEFLRESADEIEAVMPAVLDLALSMLGNLGAIELPSVGGIGLSNLRIARVVTDQDELLTILADLEVPAPPAAAATLRSGAAGERLPVIGRLPEPARTRPARTRATLVRVDVPAPADIRAGLRGAAGGRVPEVVIEVATEDRLGRALEHTWRLDGGLWRPFRRGARLVIREPALAVQGRHLVEVRARVIGDGLTLDPEPEPVPVLVDSVAPEILGDQARVDQGRLVVPARDLVSPADAIELAFARPAADGVGRLAVGCANCTASESESESMSDWTTRGLSLREARSLAQGGRLQVFARDQAGNVSTLEVNVASALRSAEQGCSAGGSGRPAGGLVLLVAATMLLLARRRTASRGSFPGVRGLGILSLALLAVVLPGNTGCGGGKSAEELPPGTCELHEHCDGLCTSGSVGFCLEGTCECVKDLPHGRIGQDADMVLLTGGEVRVSAYNALYGDLTVGRRTGEGAIENQAWTFVDGVPAGPVAIESSEVRSGIREHGEDVGRYTSIAAAPDGTVMVSYYDPGNGSLRFAMEIGGVWQSHTVDPGMVPDGESSLSELVGRYSSLSVNADDGRPGIAYHAHITNADGTARTELRFAGARIPRPQGPEDWLFYVVDKVILPSASEQAQDPYPIAPGLGLFVSSARAGDQAPVLAYYDRANGDLKLARFDTESGVFAVPELLDGAGGRDVGWYPSLAIDEDDVAHVSYVSASPHRLLYINSQDRVPVVVDDGYREAGLTETGLPRPVLHRVGDDSSLVLTSLGPVIAYQDATTRELRMARLSSAGDAFEHERVAGGFGSAGHGFYISTAYSGGVLVISDWVVDPAVDRTWIQIHRVPLGGR